MKTTATLSIDAPVERVWAVFTDTQHWPDWTASVSSVEALDGPALEVGHRFRIKQPRFPKLDWEVTAVDAPRSWTWAVRSAGATTSATHVLTPRGASATEVEQVIDQRGPLGVLVGLLTRRLTRRYLKLEGEGLRAAVEKAEPLAPQP